ncbi:MAG: DegT/DnrJ/EryC1/StrS family aminotransferase [Candidatus Sifarchaeia archaeon]|jgi:dTDP-4-amino-4,6-dideoxygalactose transaminase
MSINSILGKVEKRVAAYVGTKHAVVCSSARNAILFSVLALGIGHGNEVVIPDFACQILPVTVFCTGATPRFCDVNKRTFAMTSDSLKKALKPRTKAAILIHPLGLVADVSEIKETAEETNIFLIEDAAQSLGASINHRKTGSFGHIGVLSFYKFLDCNIGGAAVTNNEDIANKIRKIRAKKEKQTHMLGLGYRLMEAFKLNSRRNISRLLWLDSKIAKHCTEKIYKKQVRKTDNWITMDSHLLGLWRANALSSAVINQLMGYDGSYWHRRKMVNSELLLLNKEFNNLEIYLKIRRKIAKEYDELLEKNEIEKIPILPGSRPSYLRYPIIVQDKQKRNKLRKTLKVMGFNTKHYSYRPLHKSPIFGYLNRGTNFPGSTYVSEHILPLPIVTGKNSIIFDAISLALTTKKAVDKRANQTVQHVR